MADGVNIDEGTDTLISAEEVTTLNGSSVTAQKVQRIAAAVVTTDGVAKDLLLGQQARAASLAATLSTEDITALTPPAAIAGFATSAKQDSEIALLTALAGYLDGVEGGQASILAKLIAAPATEAKQDSAIALLTTQAGYLDGVEGALASILAKLLTAPATEAKQDTGNTSLASILAKIIAAPSTEAKQDAMITLLTTQAGYLDGVEALLGRLPSGGAASDATLTTIDGHVDGLEAALGTSSDAAATAGAAGTAIALLRAISRDLVANIVLKAGSAIIGKVGIDQTTPGTTDSVSVSTAQGAGAAIGAVSGAKVVTDANGTIQQYLRGLVTLWIAGLPAGSASIGTVQPGNTANTTAWLMKTIRSTTPTQTSVPGSASTGTILASNSARLGATIYNDSSAVLYLKLGATASTTSFTVAMAAASYYEVPSQYTGIIDGIWASATGNARITEIA